MPGKPQYPASQENVHQVVYERVTKMQSVSEEAPIQRLIPCLSELERLNGPIISGQRNFRASSQAYLQFILDTLRVAQGAILRFHPIERRLVIESSIDIDEKSLIIPVSDDEIALFLEYPILELARPPRALKLFLDGIQPQLQALSANIWVPLKIHDEFLGIISLGQFLPDVKISDWARELLHLLANQVSIVIAHSRVTEEMRATKSRLFLLSDMNAQISKLLDTDGLEKEVVAHAAGLLEAQVGYLMRIDSQTQRLEITSRFALDSQFNTELRDFPIPLQPEQEISAFPSMLREVATTGRTHLLNDEKLISPFGRKNLIAVPIFGREILGVLAVCDKGRRDGIPLNFTQEDQILLEAFANQAGVAIENAQLYQEALERRRLKAEMEEAAKIQKNLLPESSPEIPGYEVAGLSLPGHDGVGGDYFDYIPKPDGSWGLAIADVSGKGMQAALLMVMLRTGLRSEVARQDDLPTMAVALNSLLYESSTVERYATLVYAHLQPETGVLTLVNAGHNCPPLLIRRDGSVEHLEDGGLVLGMYPEDMRRQIADYEQQTVQLFSGDTVIFYTDGVTEASTVDYEDYGEERFEALVKQLRHTTAAEICTAIHDAVIEFRREPQHSDDLTVMVLRKVD
jgi:phosphoserine phosphatase RsbU/P